MKRVLLLVRLIVSLVELDWERDRIYLLSSIGSMLLVLSRELMGRRKVQRVAPDQAVEACEVSSDAYAADSMHHDYRAENDEKAHTITAMQEAP